MQFKAGLLLLAASFFINSGDAAGQSGRHYAVAPRTANTETMSAEVFTLTNAYRSNRRLDEVTQDAELNRLALRHSADMASGKVPFSHNGFDGRAATYRKAGGGFVSRFSENVAVGSRSAEEVMEGWIASKGHRKNIEGDYNRMGVGIVRGKDGALYFTQLFARKE